jgi:hypothetical protein
MDVINQWNHKRSDPVLKIIFMFYIFNVKLKFQMKAPIQHTNVGEYTFEEQRLETFKVWPFNEDSQCNARKVQYKFDSIMSVCIRIDRYLRSNINRADHGPVARLRYVIVEPIVVQRFYNAIQKLLFGLLHLRNICYTSYVKSIS